LAHLEELFKSLHEVNMKIHPKKWVCYHFSSLPWTQNFAKWYYGSLGQSSNHFGDAQSYRCLHFEELHRTMQLLHDLCLRLQYYFSSFLCIVKEGCCLDMEWRGLGSFPHSRKSFQSSPF
jgi:hypothetical protein